MIGVTLVLVALAMASLWLYSRHRHNYWASMGIQTPPYSALWGHLHKMINSKQGRWVFDTEAYQKYGGSYICGLYMIFNPVLMVGDPELLRCIFVKDFDSFADRSVFKSAHKNDEIFNGVLSNENGEKWKNLRNIMTPTFSSGKIRSMFPLVCDKADALVSFSLREASVKPSVNMKSNFGRFTVDTIASCAFGIECNSFASEDSNVFAKKADVLFSITFGRALRFVGAALAPSLFKALKLRLNPHELMFFKEVCEETIAQRRRTGQKRGDFLDLLLEAQAAEDSRSSPAVLNDLSIASQCVLFILNGYETTSSVLSFVSFLLSKHPEEQRRLRQEIQQAIEENGGFTYQAIMEAKYLDACIQEALRLYPPSVITERICTKTYRVPGTQVTLRPGDSVNIPIWCLHHDEKYWPEPDLFKPDRFMPENKANIKKYTHIPFGVGPRNCIAMRFALMEAKVALAKMVLAAEVSLAPGHETLELSTEAAIVKPLRGSEMILTPLSEE